MPLLTALEYLLTAPERTHIIALLLQYAPLWALQMPWVLTPDELAQCQRVTLGATRERMLREFAAFLDAFTSLRPLIVWIDDLHWSDPSTLDCLTFLACWPHSLRLFFIGTYRPSEMLTDNPTLAGMMQELQSHELCHELSLSPLSTAAVETYVWQHLPAACAEHHAFNLYDRSEGHPLFLSAMVNDIVAREDQKETWTQVTPTQTADGPAPIPHRLRQLVNKQMGRLAKADQLLLEAASVAGVEFSISEITAALQEDPVVLERHCHALARRQLFVKACGIEQWPDNTCTARFAFLHALYQQFWAERVALAQKQRWHQRIGERLEWGYGQRSANIAARIASHFTHAGDARRAVIYTHLVAEHALQRYAHREALTHLTTGLSLVPLLPDSCERQQLEFQLLTTLGPVLLGSKGYAAPEVERIYDRARALYQTVDAPLSPFVIFVATATGRYRRPRRRRDRRERSSDCGPVVSVGPPAGDGGPAFTRD